MRTLSSPPVHVIDPVTHSASTGSYDGSLPRVNLADLGLGAAHSLAKRKRWVYVSIHTPELLLGIAVVRLGYVSKAFTFAYDAQRGKIDSAASVLGPTLACNVGDDGHHGMSAVFSLPLPKLHVSITKPLGERDVLVSVESTDLTVKARLDASAARSISAIAPLGGPGLINATEKRLLMPVVGEAISKGRKISLDGALAGYDYTQGYMPRRTAWKWASVLGAATTGERVGVNLVEGFVGEAECGVWVNDELHAVGEGRFEHDPQNPLAPWRVTTTCGAVDLRFTPGDAHREKTQLMVVASSFIQAAGRYSGTITLPGRPALTLDGVLGVTEDQDTLW
ncbi:MAG: DUF2804 domain-containing protein [Polyangiaceae bacterium]